MRLRSRTIRTIFLIAVCTLVAIYRYVHLPTDDAFLSNLLKTSEGKVGVIGIVVDEAVDKGTGTGFSIRIKGAYSNVLISAPPYTDVQYGDEVEIQGTMKKPALIIDESGKVFDYPQYLAVKNIFYIATAKSVQIRSRGHGSAIRRALIFVKQEFISAVSSSLPEPHALLANGLVVAGKGALGKDLQEEFKRAGLIHIVVLSGFNVAIIAQAILAIFSFLPGRLSAISGGLGMIAFAIMTGGDAPVVRSTIMSIIGLFAHTTGRKYEAINGLIIAALIVSVINPLVPLFDSSFQLSFAATLGLILLGTPISERLEWVTEKWEMRGLVAATISTQIFVTPLLMKLSGSVSIVALGANLLVLPFVSFTMLVVFLIVAFSFIGNGLGLIFGSFIQLHIGSFLAFPWSFLAYILLSYELWIVHFFSSLSFASVSLPSPTWRDLAICYLIYAVLIYSYYRYQERKKHLPITRWNK